MRPLARRVLTEPLLHFLLLGGAIFALHAATADRPSDVDAKRIVITRGDVEHLAAEFAKLQQRPPTSDELVGLVRERVRDEVLAREAKALGLDVDDAIVRRRLRQKMEFLVEDVIALAEPTEADLEAYLRVHPDSFRVEPKVTFRHVFLSREKRGAGLAADAQRLLEQLRDAESRKDPAEMGDATLLASRFEAVSAADAARQFGSG